MRIVSLVPSATEIVAALGLGDQLVGITHSCDYPASLSRLPRVTSTRIPEEATSAEIDRTVRESVAKGWPLYELDGPQIEEMSPDLIVAQGICDVCAVGETQAVGDLSHLLRARLLSLHPHRFTDVLDDVMRVGRAAGIGERAREVVGQYEARVARVREMVGKRARPTVVVLEWIDPPYSCGHWTPDVVGMAGGVELLAEGGARSRELDWDEIRRADPDVLVLACCGQDVARTLRDLAFLQRRPGFSELRAVRRERVYVADGGALFSRPGPRLVDALEMLAETLHGGGRYPALEAVALTGGG